MYFIEKGEVMRSCWVKQALPVLAKVSITKPIYR